MSSFPIFTLLNLNNSSFLNKNDFKILSIGSESIHNCDYIVMGHITLIFKGYIYNFQELVDLFQPTEKNSKVGELQMILRVFLVGSKMGPGLFIIAETIGKLNTLERIENALKVFEA